MYPIRKRDKVGYIYAKKILKKYNYFFNIFLAQMYPTLSRLRIGYIDFHVPGEQDTFSMGTFARNPRLKLCSQMSKNTKKYQKLSKNLTTATSEKANLTWQPVNSLCKFSHANGGGSSVSEGDCGRKRPLAGANAHLERENRCILFANVKKWVSTLLKNY